MDLKALLDFVRLRDLSVDDSLQYIHERLGSHAISRDEMQYWWDFYRQNKTPGRRCRCFASHPMYRYNGCSSGLYCCEKPFELDNNKLVVSTVPMSLTCHWESQTSENGGAFYFRNDKERSCTINGRYVIQYSTTLSTFKLYDLFYKKFMTLEYKDAKLVKLARTRLHSKSSIKICEFQVVGNELGLMLIRSNDYFENVHRMNGRNNVRPYASALCLVDINIEKGYFKMIDVCVIEDLSENNAAMFIYDRFPNIIGNNFKENVPLGLFVARVNTHALMRFSVVNRRLEIGEITEIRPQVPNELLDEAMGGDNDPFGFHQMIFMQDRRDQILMMHGAEGRINRNRQPLLMMHTLMDNKIYAFEYKFVNHNAGFIGNRHITLLLDRIFVYNLIDQIWYDLAVKTPFPDNKLLVLNHNMMRHLWIDNMIYCAVELEPSRTSIITFDFTTLEWKKLDMYFLDQVFNILSDHEGNTLIETRHKVTYNYVDALLLRQRQNDQNDQPEREIMADTKVFAFYRLPFGQPQSLLTSTLLACRDLVEKHPNSKLAKIFTTMNLNATHAPIKSKMEQIPLPKPTPRRRPIAQRAQRLDDAFAQIFPRFARLNQMRPPRPVRIGARPIRDEPVRPVRRPARNRPDQQNVADIPPLRRSERLRNLPQQNQ